MVIFCKTIVILFIVGCVSGVYAQFKPLKVGMSAAFTGPSGHLGSDFYKGASYVFSQYPEITVSVKDDQYNPSLTIKNTIELITQENVDYLFGFTGTPTVSAILPLLVKYDIPLFFPFTGAEILLKYPYNNFVYNFRPSYWDEINMLVDHLVSINKTRIAIFYQKDAYGMNGVSGLRRKLRLLGLPTVSEVNYIRGKTFNNSFDKEASLLLDEEPDAIICIGSYQASAGFIRDVRKKNKDVVIANISFSEKERVLELLCPTESTSFKNLLHSQVVSSSKPSKVLSMFLELNEYQFDSVVYEGYLAALTFIEFLKRHTSDPSSSLADSFSAMKAVDIGLHIPLTSHHNQLLKTVFLLQSGACTWKDLK